MKAKLISIIGNGLPWGMAFFALGCVIGFGGTLGQNITVKIATLVAVAALLANGLLYGRFAKSLKKLEALSVTLNDSESLSLQAPANHLVDGNLVPGKLFLMDKRLIFMPFTTKENEPPEYIWHLANLTPARFYKSIWNAGGEFLLKPEGDISIMFEVDTLKPWKLAFNGG